MHASLLFIAALAQGQSADSVRTHDGRGRPTVDIPRIEAEVAIDGALDEAPWREAAVLSGFSQYQPVDGRPAEERTEVLVWYSPSAIHFGIVAHDRQPGAVRATVADRDEIGGDDRVTIYLDTFDDRRRAYFFAVNPLGIQSDGVRSEGAGTAGNLFGGNTDDSPDFLFDSKGRRTPEGYVVEVRIPFKSLRYPGGESQRWGINVERVTQRTGYTDTWTDVRRANASFLAQSGHIAGLHDLRAGVVVEAQPFITASAAGARTDGGTFEREKIDPSAGLNLKLGFTRLAVDATLNPDFSQVEADAGVVTVNERFDIFFAERRPFFLEGIELFATPNNLVYTRRVADPIVGGKVTGKFGAFGVAHLTAVDDLGDDEALFGITRLRRDLGSSSTVALTATNRFAPGGDYNHVVAADARIVFARLYFVQGQFGRSWTRAGEATPEGDIWELQFDRTGRAWGFNYRLTGIGEEFVSQSGFVPRTGYVEASAFNRLSFYGGRGAFVENFTTFFGPNRLWDYDGFGSDGPIEGDEEINFDVSLRGGWSVNAQAERNFVRLDPADYAGYTVGGTAPGPFVPPAELSNNFSGSLGFETPTWRGFDAGAEVEYGETPLFEEAAAGRGFSIDAGFTVRPTAQLRAQIGNVYARFTRAADGSEFARTIIPRLRLEYQPSRALFFRFIGEYVAERRAALVDPVSGAPLLVDGAPAGPVDDNRFRMDWLASYEPTPGTVVFLGYGARMRDDEAFRFRRLRRSDDGFFVKVAYLFRR
jgi:hypothetical protein